jgi:hypothetical protein
LRWYWWVDGLIDYSFLSQLMRADAVPLCSGLKLGDHESDAAARLEVSAMRSHPPGVVALYCRALPMCRFLDMPGQACSNNYRKIRGALRSLEIARDQAPQRLNHGIESGYALDLAARKTARAFPRKGGGRPYFVLV